VLINCQESYDLSKFILRNLSKNLHKTLNIMPYRIIPYIIAI